MNKSYLVRYSFIVKGYRGEGVVAFSDLKSAEEYYAHAVQNPRLIKVQKPEPMGMERFTPPREVDYV